MVRIKQTSRRRLATVLFTLFLAACSNGIVDDNTDPAPVELEERRPTREASGTNGRTTAEQARPGDIGIGDPYFPELGNSGYDVQHYDIEMEVNVVDQQISAVTTIEAVATQPLSAFNLDFDELEIDQVLVNDGQADFRLEDGELTIVPAEPLQDETRFSVQIVYSGSPRPHFRDELDFPTGWFWSDNASFVISEPFGAQSWYPVNNHPLDKASYSFRVTVPDPLVVAANGLLRETNDGDGTTTYVWEASDPMASYLATVSIGEFDMLTEESATGLPIVNFFPKSKTESLQDDFSPTSEMLTFFSDLFGPYPFESYGVIVLNIQGSFALETQTRSIFPFTFTREAVVAHELAHQWFGNSVSLEEWGDLWLKEGFATYAEWLWFEHTDGKAAFNSLIGNKHLLMSEAAKGEQYVIPGQPPADNLYSRSVYDGGAMVLHGLRLQVGDDVFFQILREFADRHRYGNASTEDFITLAEEVSGQELTSFFDRWLYSSEVPELQ